MKNPEISVIVPVYNIASFIGDCIESILSQNFKDFELIIIDDGSDDDSLKICYEYKELDPRIIILEGGHMGVGAARNAGLDKARGKYICFVDGDDIIHPKTLETLYNVGQQHEADIVITDFKRIKSDYKTSGKTDINALPPTKIAEKEVFKLLFDEINYMTGWGKLYKKNVVGTQRFSSFSLGEDVEFNSRVFPRAKRFFYIPSELYFYRERDNSAVSSKFNLNNLDNVTAYYSSYINIKETKPRYVHHALIRLYKNILSLNYISPPEYKALVDELNRNVYENTGMEFLKNIKINPALKLFFIPSLKFPTIYKRFRQFMEWRSKRLLTKRKN